MGIGGSVIFSTKRGSEKCDGSENQYFTSAVIGAVILSILAWIGAICFERPILTFFGADGSYHCPHLCVILPAAAVQHLLDLLFPGDHEAEGSVRCFCGTGTCHQRHFDHGSSCAGSQSERSNFFRFLFTLLTSYYGDKAKEVLKRLLEEYRLGATRDGSVIFWQIDRTGKVRTGKVMQYNPEDGHRIKGGQTSAVNWIHSILKKQRVLAEDWQLSQCLFGEHLLKTHPDKVVVLVESEKSAVIGSAIFPDYVWLATGGKSQMREEKLRVLSGRTVLLFPDADAYAEWKQRAESMYFCKVVVSDIIERNATPKQKEAHIDIADWIIFQIREGKVMSTANHLVEAERILQRMIEKNPVLQKLIDDLDLVLVGASPIGNDDEKPP